MSSTESPVAIVTGASSGIGRDTALLLAEAGYAVVLVARRRDALEEAAHFIVTETTTTERLEVVSADVADPAAAEAIVEATLTAFGRVDALANCAGSAPLQPIDRLTDELVEQTLAVNLKSVISLTRAVWPHFRKQEAGAICNVSSFASLDPFTGFNVYAAAKAGVNLFTRCTADEGRKLGITAAAVAPGAVETPMLRQNFKPNVIPEAKTLDPLTVAGVIVEVLRGQRPDDNGQTIPLPSPA